MLQPLSRWMLSGSVAAVGAASLLLAQSSSPQLTSKGDDPAIELRVTRFWAPGAGQTEVLAIVGIPYQLATPTGSGANARLAYKVTLRVTDDKGTELAMDSMRRQAPASFRQPGAVAMEQLRFMVKPGKYFLAATVVDSVTGKAVSDSISFDGYAEAPPASDLLLTNNMRLASANDTVTADGEIARGVYRLVPNSEVRIDLTRPSVAFMIETYPKKKTQADLTISVSTVAGEPLVDVKPVKFNIPANGAIIAAQIPLEGIPQGRYVVTATVVMDGKTTTRETPFTVTDPEIAVRRMVQAREQGRRTDQGYFTSLPDDSLDAAEEVLSLLKGSTKELATFSKDLSITAKRQFLIEFWNKRNPNKSPNAEDAARVTFYKSVEYVNKLFSERLQPAGWKTDRGRLWVTYGAPDDSVSDAGGTGAPITIWKWTKSHPFWVVFADKSRTGQYRIMKALDDIEPGNLDWINIVTPPTILRVVEPFTGATFNLNLGGGAAGGGGGGLDQHH